MLLPVETLVIHRLHLLGLWELGVEVCRELFAVSSQCFPPRRAVQLGDHCGVEFLCGDFFQWAGVACWQHSVGWRLVQTFGSAIRTLKHVLILYVLYKLTEWEIAKQGRNRGPPKYTYSCVDCIVFLPTKKDMNSP